jgi:hypothetical protein
MVEAIADPSTISSASTVQVAAGLRSMSSSPSAGPQAKPR